jgi:hypothetical protein
MIIKVNDSELEIPDSREKDVVKLLQTFIKRWEEIEAGKNLGTRYPLYVVYDVYYSYVYGNISSPHNNRGIEPLEVFLFDGEVFDTEDEIKEYCDENEIDYDIYGVKMCEKITNDKYVAAFLISEAAHNYIKRQSHNLSDPYVYVEYTGYANYEFEF